MKKMIMIIIGVIVLSVLLLTMNMLRGINDENVSIESSEKYKLTGDALVDLANVIHMEEKLVMYKASLITDYPYNAHDPYINVSVGEYDGLDVEEYISHLKSMIENDINIRITVQSLVDTDLQNVLIKNITDEYMTVERSYKTEFHEARDVMILKITEEFANTLNENMSIDIEINENSIKSLTINN